MKAIELAKAYDPKDFEDRIYESWKAAGHFKPAGENGKKPFVIVIPPPNVTGVLHMGHGLNNSLQDIAIRYNRMLGRPTLWVPGSDHAGIATQHVVEKRLRAKGILRRDLGREKFVQETWKVANEHHDIIKKQLEKIGSSCDWSRERFTLDEGLSKAVREVFVTLYERGLVYKGEYLVNWCPSCGTALADDEVEHSDENGAMYHIYYEFVDPPSSLPKEAESSGGIRVVNGRAYIEIATTRPETLLGDTAVACHPEDPRYKGLVGRMVKLPLTDRTIPIIQDAYVDREFGTGLVKITPAHDPNDFEVGNRHNLERINILTPDGRLSDAAPAKYRGMTVKDARASVLDDLKAQGLFVREEPITHSVGHCYRCHTVVEPFLSEQWFVRMQPLADKALKAWRDGDVNFYPQRWENTYEHWLTNIRDWCISRQLWWGHRIPAWYCQKCGKMIVSREDPTVCPHCASTSLKQDDDVLDTWFSSWLWPFSTLGWPEETEDLKRFYPTSVLVTGYDIIFFWVARMIMAGMEFMGQSPFKDVCLTTLIRDKQGRKMSKSLGNGIDPLEIVDQYGADALRFTLAFMFTASQDVLIDKDDFKLGSKFANKIWNASRYILGNLEGRELLAPGTAALSPLDRWIRHRLGEAARSARSAFESYRFNDAAQVAYEFFWNDFCDWYIEGTKLSFRSGDEAEKNRAATAILDVLEESLRLLHPLLPFVTEEIYSMLPNRRGDLIVQNYPEWSADRSDPELAGEFESVMEFVRLVRTLRSEFGIGSEKSVRTYIRFEPGSPARANFGHWAPTAALLVNGPNPEVVQSKVAGAIALVGKGFEAYVQVKDAIDGAALAQKFRKEADKERAFAERVRGKLANEAFLKSAPEAVVDKEKEKLVETERRVAKLEQYVKELA